MGFFSLHGLANLNEIIDVLRHHTGHRVQLRALATMVNLRTRFTQEVLEELQRHFEGNVFATRIRNNVRLREASSHGIPITEYQPKSNGALDYQAVANEVVALEAIKETRLSDVRVPVFEPALPMLRRELSL